MKKIILLLPMLLISGFIVFIVITSKVEDNPNEDVGTGELDLVEKPPPRNSPVPIATSGRISSELELIDITIAPDIHEASEDLRFLEDPKEAAILARKLLEEGSDEAVSIWARELLRNDQSSERQKALADAVKYLTAPGSDELIASLLEVDYSPLILSLAKQELGYRATSETVDYLLEIYSEQSLSPDERGAALNVISGIYSEAAMPHLVTVLEQSEDPEIIQAVSAPIARYGHSDGVEMIARIAAFQESRNPGLASNLREVLANVTSPDIGESLQRIFESQSMTPLVQKAARSALEKSNAFKEVSDSTRLN